MQHSNMFSGKLRDDNAPLAKHLRSGLCTKVLPVAHDHLTRGEGCISFAPAETLNKEAEHTLPYCPAYSAP